jgi:hypothetical protein
MELLCSRIVPQTQNDWESGRTDLKAMRSTVSTGIRVSGLKRQGTLGTAIGASDAPEDQRQETRIIDVGERIWSPGRTWSAGAPAQNTAVEMINAQGVAARMFGRPFLNQHIHLTWGEFERAHIEIAADEFDCEAISRNEQTGLPWPSH